MRYARCMQHARRVHVRLYRPISPIFKPILPHATWNSRQRNMPRRKQQAPKRLKARDGDVDRDDVSPGELADDESDDVEEEKETRLENPEAQPLKEVKKEASDEETRRVSTSSCLSPSATPLQSPTTSQTSPIQGLSLKNSSFMSTNGPMSMLSKMCTALSGTDSDSDEQDSDLEAVIRFTRLGMCARQTIPEQEEALDLRVSKVKRRKDLPLIHDKHLNKSKRSSEASSGQSPSKGVKTVFCETVPRDVLASVSRLQTDYSVLPSQVSLCRGINGRCNFVLCTDCYQAFPNVGMLSLHLIATGHNSTKQLNSEHMLQKGYLALVPPRTEFFSTCALRRKQRLPAASSRKELCAYTCSTCSLSFPDFLDYTVHLTTSGHDKHDKSHVSQSKSTSGDCSEEIPVNQVLKCMICQASFRTLKDLTMHMVRTKHYSHVPGHAGILLTRANSKPDDKGLDEADDEDTNMLDEDECHMPTVPISESLPVSFFTRETDNLSRREKRNSESSVSSREDVCQNKTKVALNQLLAARSQRISFRGGRSRSLNTDGHQKVSKTRSLKCLGCSHLFANVHKLTEHMKETGHFLAPSSGHDASNGDGMINKETPTSGLSPTAQKLPAEKEMENDSEQPRDKIKIVLKDGASKQQLLSVSSLCTDSESKKAAVRDNKTDSMECTESKPKKKFPKAASVENLTELAKRASPPENTPAKEVPHLPQCSPSPPTSPQTSSIRYVNPDNFDELFPSNLSRHKSPSNDVSTENPLDQLTSMVENAKEKNFQPKLRNQHYHHHHHHPLYNPATWMPMPEPSHQQLLNGGGMFPSYAGLAMVYNALSLASSPSSEAISSKMEKCLAAKESENVTVAEAIDKILSHSFRKEDKTENAQCSPKLSTSTRDHKHGQRTDLRPNVHKSCPLTKHKTHSRRCSRNSRSERLKRAIDAKEALLEYHVHRKMAKKRHSVLPDPPNNSLSKGIVSHPKRSGKSLHSLKYRMDIQRLDQSSQPERDSQGQSSTAGRKRGIIKASTVSLPVHRYVPKKGFGSLLKKSTVSTPTQVQNKLRTDSKKRKSLSETHKHLIPHMSNAHLEDKKMSKTPEHNDSLPHFSNTKPARSTTSESPKHSDTKCHSGTFNHSVDNITDKNNFSEVSVHKNKRKPMEKEATSSVSSSRHDIYNGTATELPNRLPNSIDIKKEKPDDAIQDKSPNQTDTSRLPHDIPQNDLNPNNRSPDKKCAEMSIPRNHSVTHNGESHRDSESFNHEGHLNRLKKSLEMYKMFHNDSPPVPEKRQNMNEIRRHAHQSHSKMNLSPPLLASVSGQVKIKQEPGIEVQKCLNSNQDYRLKSPSLHAPVKRTHNNNTLPHSVESKSTDSESIKRNSLTPESPTCTNSLLNSRKNSEYTISNLNLTKFTEATLYPNSDPLHEIDKLVNNTTGIPHNPPGPPKVARISVDVTNRGAYTMKRDPEMYVNPGNETIKTNPLEEMCKMLNATHR